MHKYTVKKDFLSLKKDDIIEIYIVIPSNVIYVNVEKRIEKRRIYGEVREIDVSISYNTMELRMPSCPDNLEQDDKMVYTLSQWWNICLDNMISQFKDLGVI